MGTIIEALLRSTEFGMWFHSNVVSDALGAPQCNDYVLAFNAGVNQGGDIGEHLSTLIHQLQLYSESELSVWVALSKAIIIDTEADEDEESDDDMA